MSEPQTLKFPVRWEYRVFAEAGHSEQIRSSLVFLLNNYTSGATVRCGNVSAGGKYQILIAAVDLPSREIMDKISADMAKIPGVRYVL